MFANTILARCQFLARYWSFDFGFLSNPNSERKKERKIYFVVVCFLREGLTIAVLAVLEHIM